MTDWIIIAALCASIAIGVAGIVTEAAMMKAAGILEFIAPSDDLQPKRCTIEGCRLGVDR